MESPSTCCTRRTGGRQSTRVFITLNQKRIIAREAGVDSASEDEATRKSRWKSVPDIVDPSDKFETLVLGLWLLAEA